MLDPSLMEVRGAQSGAKHLPLATIKFIAGLQTQRSPFASIDTRYNSRFLGGKPDALIAGSNVEVSNSLTLQRRFGHLAYGTVSIPAPLAFYEHKPSVPPSSQLIVDTASAVYNYSPTAAGLLWYKSPNAGQTNFMTVVNTLYAGDGVDLFKYVGPNQLLQSNTFTDAAWTPFGAALTPDQFDPLGGTAATLITWTYTSSYLKQAVTPNYTPVAGNTFTFSIWARAVSGSPTVTLYVMDQAGANLTSNVVTLSQTWTRYQVTGTLGQSSTQAVCEVGNPSSTGIGMLVYGAQLEVGGPATPTQLTTTMPQGVYLWGIQAPTVAPTIASTTVGVSWQSGHAYNVGDSITDTNGNREVVTVAGTSGGSQPTWPLTVGTTTTDSGVTWKLIGPNGLSPKAGYQWYYAFLNPYTGQPSNVSPLSPSTTTLPNNLGVNYTLTGVGSTDPQVKQIAVYRNVDGGPYYFQVGVIANPAGGGTWTFVDNAQDSSLSSIAAPIALLNSPPPAGAVAPAWFQARAWVAVGATLYYSTGPDNAALLNVTQNGVVAESWLPSNNFPLDQTITRSIETSGGLLVMTVADYWIVTGTDLSSFNPVKALKGHGLRSYNAADADGSTIWAYTSDRQFLQLNSSAGSVEVGYPIGDQLLANVDPAKAYVARHVGGSVDNAVFLGDGATGWFRMNPNQVGASVSGEPTAVWSPFATITGGAQAIASVETSPGVHQLLVGFPGGGAIQTLGNIAGTGANDASSGTAWTNPSNVTLDNPASPATVTLNVQATPSGVDVFGGSSGTGTSMTSGNVTTTQNNELGIAVLRGSVAGAGTTTITPGAGWTLDAQASIATFATSGGAAFLTFGGEHKALATAGTYAATGTLSNYQPWDALLVSLVSANGAAPSIVQSTGIGSGESFGVAITPTSNVTVGNFLVVLAGVDTTFGADATALSVVSSLGNMFTRVATQGGVAIFVAPITQGGSETITLGVHTNSDWLALMAYEVTLPQVVGAVSSKKLQATNFNLNVPTNNILGVKVYVTGSQSSTNPDAEMALTWIGASGAPSYSFQLPATTGTVSFGGVGSTWGQALTAALLNSSLFGFQLQASVTVTANVVFNVTAVKVQVFYLNGAVQTFRVMVRDINTFSDLGTPYTWDATIGSLFLAYPGTLAEVESITTMTRAANGAQPSVAVLLDEITGAFETLPAEVTDPPQLTASSSVLAQRFYLSQGTVPPVCQHLQLQLSGGATATKDEVLAVVVRGALVPEQS